MGPVLSRRLVLGGAAALLAASQARAFDRPVSVYLDYSDAPQLELWAQELKRRLVLWWPIVNDCLRSPEYTPVDVLHIKFSNAMPEHLAGHTEGPSILLNAPYITAHPTYYNFVGHELVHVVQNYRRPFSPWLTEGMADWVRYYVLFPQDRERFFDPKGADYRRGYQPAAALLDYVERSCGLGSVRKINAALRRGEDGEAVIERMAQNSLDRLWSQVLAALADGSPPPRA